MNNIKLANLATHPFDIEDNCNRILNIINKLPQKTDFLYAMPPSTLRLYHPSTIDTQNDLLNHMLDRLAKELNNNILLSYPATIENEFLKIHYYILGNNKRQFIGSIYLNLNKKIDANSKIKFNYKDQQYTIVTYSDDVYNKIDFRNNNIIIHDYQPFSYQHYLDVFNNTQNHRRNNFIYQSINSFDYGKLYYGLSANSFDGSIRYSKLFGDDGLIDNNIYEAKDIKYNFDSVIHEALIVGIRRFMKLNKFTDIVIGLSGGIDSAIVAALAVESLGADHIVGLIMPSMYSTPSSVDDAVLLANNLGIENHILPITSIYDKTLETLNPVLANTNFSIAEENIQARLRMLLLMAYSNKFGHVVLNTSNKSELSVGYGTLYGDLAGAFSLIGDLYKTQVYSISKYINKSHNKDIIPLSIISKAPSAELHPGQKDEDSIPAYDLLDKILYAWIEDNKWNEPIGEILNELNIDVSDEKIRVFESVKRMIEKNEFKRHLFAPILRLSRNPLNEIILGKY
jgi:NAD+ synthetase